MKALKIKLFLIISFLLTACTGNYGNFTLLPSGPTASISLDPSSGLVTRTVLQPIIGIQFSQPMQSATVNSQSVTLVCGSQTVATTVSTTDNKFFTLVPNSQLPTSTTCTVTVTRGIHAPLSATGLIMAQSAVFSFTTRAGFLYILSELQAGSCSVDTIPGTATNCNASPGVNGLYQVSDVFIATVGGSKYAYYMNSYTKDVTVCKVDSSGLMLSNNCTNAYISLLSSQTFSSFGVAVFTDGSNPTYAYISDYTGSKIISCQVDQTTGLPKTATCQNSGATGVSVPYHGISIVKIGANTFAYVGRTFSTAGYVCTVNTALGTLSGCVATGTAPGTGASWLWVDSKRGAFISTYTNTSQNIEQCTTINGSTGALSACVARNVGANYAGKNTVSSDTNYLYVANTVGNAGGPSFIGCLLSTGVPSSCVANLTSSIGLSSSSPVAIALDNNGYLYSTLSGMDIPVSCRVTGTTVSSCQNSNSVAFNNPSGMALTLYGAASYVYIINTPNIVGYLLTSCVVNPNAGTISNCQNAQLDTSTVPAADYLYGVAAANGYLYLVDNSAGKVISCAINGATTGACQNVTPGGFTPTNGIVYNSSNSKMYISGSSDILVCNAAGGTLTGCANSTSGITASASMSFTTVSGTSTAYILTSTGGNSIKKCSVANNGTLSNCSDSGLGTSFFSSYSSVTGIATQGGYIYVTGSGFSATAIYSCLINGDGTLTGANCVTQVNDGVLNMSPISLALY